MLSFNGDASFNDLYKSAGLKLQYKFSPPLNPNNACSGLTFALGLSHFGPPTAPKSTASLLLQASKVLSGNGVPKLSIAHPPACKNSNSKLWQKVNQTS